MSTKYTVGHIASVLLFTAAALSTGSVLAAGPDSKDGEKNRRGPPAEALEACKSLSAGAACSFTSRETHQGSCEAPEGKPLACRPSDAPPPGQGEERPPAR